SLLSAAPPSYHNLRKAQRKAPFRSARFPGSWFFLQFLLIVSEIFDHKIAVPPVFFNLHPQLEVHLRLQHVFNFPAGLASNSAKHGAPFSDHNSLMGIPLTDNGSVDIHNLP